LAVFSRRSSAPQVSGGYQSFREYVREDFSECCAYCLLHELLAGGRDNFELDHFRPKSRFPELIDNFFNLYYSCHVCNLFKGNAWPSEVMTKLGYRFVDYCRQSFSEQFRQEADGSWTPLTAGSRNPSRR
jgi:HNH endonuclease